MWTMEITNTCTCQYCPQCDCTYSYVDSQDCPECKTDMQFTDCYGVCYDDAKEYAIEMIAEWQTTNNADGFIIRGNNMGWLHKSGYTDIMHKPEQGFESLIFNGEWTLRFKRENNDLSVVRSSHDELGALFTFEVATDED